MPLFNGTLFIVSLIYFFMFDFHSLGYDLELRAVAGFAVTRVRTLVS